jgi:hypothetical protein
MRSLTRAHSAHGHSQRQGSASQPVVSRRRDAARVDGQLPQFTPQTPRPASCSSARGAPSSPACLRGRARQQRAHARRQRQPSPATQAAAHTPQQCHRQHAAARRQQRARAGSNTRGTAAHSPCTPFPARCRTAASRLASLDAALLSAAAAAAGALAPSGRAALRLQPAGGGEVWRAMGVGEARCRLVVARATRSSGARLRREPRPRTARGLHHTWCAAAAHRTWPASHMVRSGRARHPPAPAAWCLPAPRPARSGCSFPRGCPRRGPACAGPCAAPTRAC